MRRLHPLRSPRLDMEASTVATVAPYVAGALVLAGVVYLGKSLIDKFVSDPTASAKSAGSGLLDVAEKAGDALSYTNPVSLLMKATQKVTDAFTPKYAPGSATAAVLAAKKASPDELIAEKLRAAHA